MIRFVVAGLVTLAAFSVQAAPTVNRFYGYAYDLKSNKYLYTEVHEQKIDGDRWLGGTIKYYAPDGSGMASKTLDFSANPYIPKFRLEIPKEGYVEAITEVTKDSFTMLKTSGGETGTKTVQITPDMAADSGFHSDIVDHFGDLRAGKTLKFRFGVAGQLDTYDFRCHKTGETTIDGKAGIKLLIEPDSWLRLLVGPLEVVYEIETRHLLDYRGISNMHNPKTGEAYNVHIIYTDKPPPMRHKISLRSELPRALLATALIGFAGSAFADITTDSLDAALKTAQERHVPVLVDFYAPWCYSCYFMNKTVKNGPEWEKLEQKAVVLELDADAPDGARWIKQWSVKGLPNYVVLDENGLELGRIPLERTRAQFYPEIDAIIARGASFGTLQARVKDGDAASVEAARSVLDAFHARGDFDGGLAWRKAQPAAVSAALDKDEVARTWVARLELQKAYAAKDAAACAAVMPRVLSGTLGCDRAYEVDHGLECTASLPAAKRSELFTIQKRALEKLLATKVFIATPACADARSVVVTAADVSKALGDKKSEATILDRAIEDAIQRLGGAEKLDLKSNRNLADNLRAYLDRAGRVETLDALYPALIEAYPDDYVYAYRFGKSLAERGQFEKALPYFEQAAPKAYGVNRLNVAQWRAQTLIKLGRNEDAKQVVADALKANGPFFPEMTTRLKAVVASN